MCTYSFELVFWVSLDTYPEVESLSHNAAPFSISSRNFILFFIVAAPIYIPTKSAQECPFVHILTSTFADLLMMAILTGVRGYLTVYHNFLIHSSTDRHVGCFHILSKQDLEELLIHVCSSQHYSHSREVEATHMSTNKWTGKGNVLFAYNKKLCSLKNKLLSYATLWMKLKDVMLSKISQSQKDKYCMISLIGSVTLK